MSDATPQQLFLQTDLNELSSAHKLSRYLLQLPHYKDCMVTNNTKLNEKQSNSHKPHHHRVNSGSLNDLIISNKLSQFVYQQQLNGRFFLNDFSKTDFYEMMELISSTDNTDKTNYDWIWKILLNAIKNSKQPRYTIHKLKWMQSPWNQYQLNVDHKNIRFGTHDIIKSDECEEVNKCKALKRVIMILHFYHSMMDEIDNDKDLILQYFAKYDNIYNDYQHILHKHWNDGNMKIIKDKISKYIKCDDINKCKSYKRKDSDATTKCIEDIKNDKINKNNMLSFCCQLLDIMHCCFLHNFSFSLNKKHKKQEEEINDNAHHIDNDGQQHLILVETTKKKNKKQNKEKNKKTNTSSKFDQNYPLQMQEDRRNDKDSSTWSCFVCL